MDIEAIEQALVGVPHGERRRKIEDIAKVHGVHFSTLYRRLQKRNGKRKAVQRENKIGDEIIEMVAQIKIRGMKKRRKGRELSTERCIRILERKGIVAPGKVSAGTVNRRLLEKGFREERRRIRFEADYANQCHQIDFSRSEYFEVVAFDRQRDDFVLMVDGRGLSYKNKPDDKKQRLWLATLRDDYSRARLVRYFVGSGESAYMGMQFYRWCLTRPEDEHPLRYVSDYWLTDNGAFAKSEPVRNMRRALSIEWKHGKPYEKETIGKTERGWRHLWQGWELETSLIMGEKATVYLSDLNEMMHREMISELSLQHPRQRGFTRGHLYKQSILQHPPREVNGDIFNLACRVIERTADIYATVSVDNEIYAVPEQFQNRRIRIYFNMNGGLMGESLDSASKFELQSYKPQSFLNYRGVKDTYRDKMEKETDEGLFENIPLPGTEQGAESMEQGAGSMEHHYMKPQAEQIEPQTPFRIVTHFESIEKAREYIGKRLNIPYSEVAMLFDDALQVTLEKSVIEEIVSKVKDAI